MSKPPTPAAVQRMTSKLREKFPDAFTPVPRPLAVGIGKAIAAELFPDEWRVMQGVFFFTDYDHGRKLSAALEAWTRSENYLRACTENAPRYNLTGEIVGTVKEEEAAYAAAELSKRLLAQSSTLALR